MRHVVVRVGVLWGHRLVGSDGNFVGGAVGIEGYSRAEVESLCERLNASCDLSGDVDRFLANIAELCR
jgi:hypothetical protein